ncbi:hypothetical protein EVA_12655 [gut metagenome]|uniref:DUF4248 domain-containing protein n=1 Tax=gut metagenome TaxID=749906 RepID=J9GBV3_9ZZZZ
MEKANISSKKEIARLYFPGLDDHQACNGLRRWIKQCVELESKLIQTGYVPKQRSFTPRQLELIFEYLGDPLKV